MKYTRKKMEGDEFLNEKCKNVVEYTPKYIHRNTLMPTQKKNCKLYVLVLLVLFF